MLPSSMRRVSTIAAVALSVAIFTAAYAHAEPAGSGIVAEQGAPLTLEAAKHAVSDHLAATGQRMLRPGHAEFDESGNVTVELQSVQGLPMGHVVVHANTGAVTDARAASKTGAKG